jgi:hypothetical protein
MISKIIRFYYGGYSFEWLENQPLAKLNKLVRWGEDMVKQSG